jgi:hypothetical protein
MKDIIPILGLILMLACQYVISVSGHTVESVGMIFGCIIWLRGAGK